MWEEHGYIQEDIGYRPEGVRLYIKRAQLHGGGALLNAQMI